MNSRDSASRAEVTLADEIEASAFVDMFAAAPRDLADRLGLQTVSEGGTAALFAPGFPATIFNRVIGLGLRAPATIGDLDRWTARYRIAGVSSWWLHWSPAAEPDGFDGALRELGFTLPARRSWAKVLRDPSAPAAARTSLQIDLARTTQIGDVAAAIVQAFEMPAFVAGWLAALDGRPRWQVYAARDGERVVGGACLFIDRDVGWLGMGGVLASHRRRGGQFALMSRRIADAIDAGCRHIVTETGEPVGDEPNPSLTNMYRCGFRRVASRLNYEAPRAS